MDNLIFSDATSQSGFTNASISASNDKDASVIVRELLQNSYDSAINDAKKATAKVKFIIDYIDKNDIPGFYSYERALNSIEKETLSEQERDIFNVIKEELIKDRIPILYIIDNGIGFSNATLCGILGDGISIKSNPNNAGGSYGNGHFSAFNMSNLRYILYGGVSQDGDKICSGQALLRTHKYGGLKDAKGFLRTKDEPILEDNDVFLKDSDIPTIISNNLSQIDGSGAVVAILGFNFFGKDENVAKVISLIASSIVRNFFVAIKEEMLEVEIISEDVKLIIDKIKLETIFYNTKEEKINPNFNTAERFYNLMSKGQSQIIETSRGGVKVYYQESNTDTRLALCRNGMWINDALPPPLNKGQFTDNKYFNALILPQRDTALSKLIRRAESNLHINIRLDRFSSDLDGRKKRTDLQSALKEVSDYLMDVIGKNDSDYFDVNIPELSINMIGDTKSKESNKRKSPKTKKVARKPKPASVDDGAGKPVGGKGEKDKSENKIRVGNPFEVGRFSSRHNAKQKIAKLQFSIEKNAANLLLSLRLEDGTDPTCDTTVVPNRLSIRSAKCNDTACKIINDDTVDIGKVNKNIPMNLTVEYETNIKGNYSIDYEFLNSASKKDEL